VAEIKDVADPYARNFLIPNNIAEIATEAKVKELEAKIVKIKKEEEKNVEEAKKIVDRLVAAKIVLKEEVNEEGHLYGAVTPKEIAEHLSEKGYEIDGADVVMEDSIKEIGEYEVIVRVGHGVETPLKIKIEKNL
jgi:large subunit ribosomal protein L9